jgi:hypothetical protein
MITVKLIELNLPDFDLDDLDNITLFMTLYDDILNSDDWWHFFREGIETLVRVSEENAADVTKWFVDQDIKVEIKGEWEDNIDITAKNQTAFMYMFHAFSVLAMDLYWKMSGIPDDIISGGYRDVIKLYDRVSHCFLNNVRHPIFIDKLRPFTGYPESYSAEILWEAMMAARMGADRVWTISKFARG